MARLEGEPNAAAMEDDAGAGSTMPLPKFSNSELISETAFRSRSTTAT